MEKAAGGVQSALSGLAEAATADIEDQGWASIKRAQPIIEQWVSAGVPAGAHAQRTAGVGVLSADRVCACADRWQREPSRKRAHGGWVYPRMIRRCLMCPVRPYAPWSKMPASMKATAVTTVREVSRWYTRSPKERAYRSGQDRDSRDPGWYIFTFFQGSS